MLITVMIHLPINAIAWSVGALTLYTFSIRSWRTYKRTQNPLAQMYSLISLTFGTALFFFGVPGLLTRDAHILLYTYFAADFFVQVTMQVGVWVLWFLGLRNSIFLRYLYLLTIPFSLVLLTWEVLTSHVSVSQSPYLIVYADKPPVLILKSIIYVAVALPIGYFLLRQVPKQVTWRAKLKSFTSGMIFIAVCLVATSNNIFDKGSDTPDSARTVLIVFIIFLLAQMPRGRKVQRT